VASSLASPSDKVAVGAEGAGAREDVGDVGRRVVVAEQGCGEIAA
jgi:hypothetical protein